MINVSRVLGAKKCPAALAATLLALVLATIGCSGSSSGGGGKGKSEKNATDLSQCRQQPKPNGIEGNWASVVSDNTTLTANQMTIENEMLSLSTKVFKSGMICNANGNSRYRKLNIRQFETLDNIYDSAVVTSSDGLNTVTCGLSLPPMVISYYFDGGCLVIVTKNGPYEFAPVTQPVVIQPPAPEPQPLPTSPPAPVSSPTPQPVLPPVKFAPIVQEICKSYAYSSDREDCFTKLKDITDLDASVVHACKRFAYPSDKEDCVYNNAHVFIKSPQVAAICQRFAYPSDEIDCLRSLDHKNIDERFIEECNKSSYQQDAVECLLRHQY